MSNDPRVYFAAERTMLAWVRTGISIQGVGFLVAKFGLFLQLLGYRGLQIGGQHISMFIGVMFVLVGSGSIAWSAWQQRRFVATLSSDQLPPRHSPWSGIGLATVLAVLGFLLAIYLSITSQIAPHEAGEASPRLSSTGLLRNLAKGG